MQTRPFGRNGPEVTAIGYGGWAIGGLGYGDQDRADAEAAIDFYLEAGGRFIDTARGYGTSEITIGKRLTASGVEDEVFVCSKSGATHPPIVATDCETSRYCLQRDVIDCYHVHVPPRDLDHLDRLLDAHVALKERGWVRFTGVSAPKVLDAEDAAFVERIVADERVDAVQIPHNIGERLTPRLIEDAAERGLAVVSRSNLQGGMLTSKYRPGHRFDDPDNDWRASMPGDVLDRIFELVREIAAAHVDPPYNTMTQLMLSYCLSQPGVTAIIPGGRAPSQVDENLSVDGIPPMDPDLHAELTAAGDELHELMLHRGKGKSKN